MSNKKLTFDDRIEKAKEHIQENDISKAKYQLGKAKELNHKRYVEQGCDNLLGQADESAPEGGLVKRRMLATKYNSRFGWLSFGEIVWISKELAEVLDGKNYTEKPKQ